MPAFTHTDGHHLSVDGARLYHEAIGPADGPALLMLHGGLGSMTDLNPIAERLAGRWRLIGIDLRGHGRSTLGNTPLTYARHEADVRAVLDALGITRCAMFGFSDGGVVAYRLAASMPERATHLATLGAQWRLNEDDPAIDMLRGMTPDLWRDIDAEAVADDQRLNPEPDVDRLVATAVACWTDLGSSGYPFDAVRRITAPTLIARGDRDELFSLDEAVALRNALPNAGLLNIPWADHDAHRSAPDVLIAALAPFLACTQP